MTLEVIGAGFGRTGTESMKQALDILGFGPCHHMYDVLSDRTRYDLWFDTLDRCRSPDWARLLGGYRSSVDWPVALYWRELADLFPQAKIVLTVRDSDGWLASMERTILKLMRDPDNNPMARVLADRVFEGRVDDRAHLIATYERNNASVRAAFGPERLLCFDLGSGWGPLCDFLGVPVPDRSYPRSNAADGFLERDAALDDRRRSAPT